MCGGNRAKSFLHRNHTLLQAIQCVEASLHFPNNVPFDLTQSEEEKNIKRMFSYRVLQNRFVKRLSL